MSKAFKPFNKSAGSSGDRTANLRREAMYKSLVSSQNRNQLSEYQETNRNFSVRKCDNIVSATGKPVSQLHQASSYRTYMDLAIAKRLINPTINGQEAFKMDGNMGAFYRLNVQANDTVSTTQANNGAAPLPVVPGTEIGGQVVTSDDNVSGQPIGGIGRISWPNSSQDDVPTSYNQFVAQNANQTGVYDNYPGYVMDPYNKMAGSCDGESTMDRIRKANANISVDARWMESYWGATGGQPLNGFSFPSQVIFGAQKTNHDDRVSSYRTAPMTRINDNNGISNPGFDPSAFIGASKRYCTNSISQNANELGDDLTPESED